MKTVTKKQRFKNYIAINHSDKSILKHPVKVNESKLGEGCSYCSCENACGGKGD